MEQREPSWTVRADTRERHYRWSHLESYEDAVRLMRSAIDYLEAIGEDPVSVRVLHSTCIKIT